MPPARFPCVIYPSDYLEVAACPILGALRVSVSHQGEARHAYIGYADALDLINRMFHATEALRTAAPTGDR